MLTRARCGMSLVELLVGLGIAAFLMMAGVPAFVTWLQNAQNRTAGELIMNGIQLARLEAVKRNAVVRFDLTDETGRIAWNVGCITVTDECPATIQSRPADEAAANARAGVSKTVLPTSIPPGYFSSPISAGTELAAGVSFNGLGRVVNEGTDIARVDITNLASADARRFVVMVSSGGLVRMCDPALSLAKNPQGCS
ncbi:GspH/FimT family pseudopilin [Noviherbaspirillum sp. ST9]|uniref:GspH/FimT family pseudopilin n=1 Tax=Noviherbaspirillum sp. ST9 TaxID=3401606 RepID=UPI003B5885AD